MLAELVTKLETLAQNASKVSLARLDGVEDPEKLVYATSKGEMFGINRPIPSRAHEVYCLDSMCQAATQWGKPDGVLWHNEEAVVLVCADAVRRDRVTLPLAFSAPWKILADLVACPGPRYLEQRQAIRLLKIDLAGCVQPEIVAAVRRVTASWGGKKESEVQQTRTKGMSEFAAELADELPEDFLVTLPVYETAGCGFIAQVRVALDVQLPPAPLAFAFSPLGGELRRAIDAAQDYLHRHLSECDAELPVYYGRP